MNSVLVALIVHLMGNTASLDGGNVPFFVVPHKIFEVDGNVPLTLTTSDTFGPREEKRWRTLVTLSGSPRNAAELCYRAAYRDLTTGAASMKPDERKGLLLQVGGHHALAIAGIRWCNASLRKIDILPLKHPEFATAEKDVRQMGYETDVKYIAACKDAACVNEAVKSFGKTLVGVPLEATK
ncbi:MAG: hypothetical protein EOP85_02120 [Verrucomicrobiaceae bacterium]|nr:MAG: hypothetical protein EOP85_02120 [Verrucomicrobiaceae bacterium]